MEDFQSVKRKLNQESKKYLNISVILKRLEQQGYLNKIYEILKEIK
jgi:hypothetical protein